MNALPLPGVMLSPRGGRGGDSVNGGESIRALILLQMELFANGQHLYLLWYSLSLSVRLCCTHQSEIVS